MFAAIASHINKGPMHTQNSTANTLAQEPPLNWRRHDIENRLGFTGGRFTTTNNLLTALFGLLATAIFFGGVIWIQQRPDLRWLGNMFLDRGPSQFVTMFLFFWALGILLIKTQKLRLQRRALTVNAVPAQGDFQLNTATARSTLDRIHGLADATGHFLLLNRIERALSNLKNIGQISDVSSILQTQAAYDEEQVNSSYGLVQGFIWAIPVVGFIGTVLGLSQAIGFFGETLKSEGDMGGIRESLQSVTAGLATAFETTLVALVCALVLQLLVTYLQTKESEFLDACNDFCHANVVSKLRLAQG